MTGSTRDPPEEGASVPAKAAGSDAALPDAALPDGGRRTVVVRPDEVWSSAPQPPPQAPEAVRREARRSFMGPIYLVGGLSTVLLLLFMAAVALLVWLRR